MVIWYEIFLCVRLSGSCCLLMTCQPRGSPNGFITTLRTTAPLALLHSSSTWGNLASNTTPKAIGAVPRAGKSPVPVPPRKSAAAQLDFCPLCWCCDSSLPLWHSFSEPNHKQLHSRQSQTWGVFKDQILAIHWHFVRGGWCGIRRCWRGVSAKVADGNRKAVEKLWFSLRGNSVLLQLCHCTHQCGQLPTLSGFLCSRK